MVYGEINNISCEFHPSLPLFSISTQFKNPSRFVDGGSLTKIFNSGPYRVSWIPTGVEIRTHHLKHVSFHPNLPWFSIQNSLGMCIHNAYTNTIIATLTHKGFRDNNNDTPPKCLHWHPNGKLALTLSSNYACVWNTATWKKVGGWEQDINSFRCTFMCYANPPALLNIVSSANLKSLTQTITKLAKVIVCNVYGKTQEEIILPSWSSKFKWLGRGVEVLDLPQLGHLLVWTTSRKVYIFDRGTRSVLRLMPLTQVTSLYRIPIFFPQKGPPQMAICVSEGHGTGQTMDRTSDRLVVLRDNGDKYVTIETLENKTLNTLCNHRHSYVNPRMGFVMQFTFVLSQIQLHVFQTEPLPLSAFFIHPVDSGSKLTDTHNLQADKAIVIC